VIHADVAKTIMIQLEEFLGAGKVDVGISENGRELEEASEVFRSVGCGSSRQGRAAGTR
jgi:hypothetical protein